jgi:hypothetical protein
MSGEERLMGPKQKMPAAAGCAHRREEVSDHDEAVQADVVVAEPQGTHL